MEANAPQETRRRRRTPEEAQSEIIAAAETLLRERPFREMTVDEVMRRTELSRPSFYVYFRDRHELVLRVVQHLFGALVVPSMQWFEDGREEDLHDALRGVVRVYGEHSHVMRALADAAADDLAVEAAYNHLVTGFIDLTRAKLEVETEAGRADVPDPLQVATALVWMGERVLYLSFRADPPPSPDAVADVLHTVWVRTIYARR